MKPSISFLAMALAILTSSLSYATPLDSTTHTLVKRDTGTLIPGEATCSSKKPSKYFHTIYTGCTTYLNTWQLDWDQDTQNGGYLQDISPGNVDLRTCIDICGKYAQCLRAVFIGDVNQAGPCYLKDGDGAKSALVAATGHVVATKTNVASYS